jgi:hypothetical protein
VKPAFVVGGARVFAGDCVEVMKSLPDNSVDSVVTDPPYGLNFMGKEWDNPGKMLGQMATGHEQRGAYAYGGSHSRGYADNDSLAFQLWCTQWAVECLRVLKPGGHILAFGGSRTWHRLAVAVEDAGFELRDSIAWIYGSGFPKSLDVSKAIDKNLGAEREKVRKKYTPGTSAGNAFNNDVNPRNWLTEARKNGFHESDGPNAATSEAKTWEGWGTALKPAHEPIVVGRKPLVGTVAENVLAWGVGGLNIDGSRIGSRENAPQSRPSPTKAEGWGMGGEGKDGWTSGQGRWPANVILDEVTAGLLDEQSGVLKSGAHNGNRSNVDAEPDEDWVYKGGWRAIAETIPANTGGASRFFYVAKASKRDRNEGLEELEAVVRNDGRNESLASGDMP